MTGHLNISGTWKDLQSAYCKVNGEWKEIKSGYAKDNDEWKEIYSASKVYGLIYDKSLASDPAGCLTYARACKGFAPIIAGNGAANEGSWAEGNETLFDSIKVGYLTGSTFVEQNKNAVEGSDTHNCFTRIPKIYQKVTQLDSKRIQLDLSLEPFSGATLHPAFIIDGVEYDFKDIGRYLASNDSSVNKGLDSKLFKGLKLNTSYNTFRKMAQGNGANYWMMSYYDWDLVNKLVLFALKSWDAQNAFGTGRVSMSSTSGHSSDGQPWMFGNEFSVEIFGINDWWGNCSAYIDNFMLNSDNIYVSQLSSPSNVLNTGMDVLCVNPGISGYPLTCRAGLNDFFIGEDTAGSESTGICDEQSFSKLNYDVAHVGGSYAIGSRAGPFYINSSSKDSSLEYVSTRLVHWE